MVAGCVVDRTTRRLLVAALVLLSVTAAYLPVSDAWTSIGTGCRYDPKNDDDGLGLGFNTGGSLYDADERLKVEHAASSWNAAMVPNFTVVTWGSSKQDLKVTWANLGASIGGRLSYTCGSNHWTQDPTFSFGANATYYVASAGRRKAIAIHELGHSYGLHHNSTAGCGAGAGLMASNAVGKYDLCLWSGPTADDVTGATTRHNAGS